MSSPNLTTAHSPVAALRALSGALGRRGIARMAIASIAIMLSAILTNAPAFLISWFFDRFQSGAQAALHIVGLLVAALAASVIARELLDYLRKWLVESSAVQLHRDEFVSIVRRLLDARVDAVQDNHAAEIATRIERGVAGLIRMQKLFFLEFGPQFANALVAVIAAAWAHWSLSLIMLFVFLSNAAITLAQIRSQKGIRIALERQHRHRNSGVGELVTHLDSVRASGSSAAEVATLADHAETLRATELTHHVAMMRFDAAKNGVEAIGLVVVVGAAFFLMNLGQITPGSVLLLAMLYLRAAVPLQMLHRILDEAHEAAIMVGEAATLRVLPKDPGLEGRSPVTATLLDSPVITMDGLSVDRSPRNGSVMHVLRDCSLSVNSGAVVGLKGETGSGKSTLLQVVLGIVPDYLGSVRVFGTEVRCADKSQLYRSLAYVGQQPFLKAGTLRDNLLIGSQQSLSDDQLIRGLSLAGLQLEGNRWADGLATRIPERGANLAGGERQRIALARLFLSDAKLILLDEATSALDEQTEHHVMRNLREHASGRTVLMIAHRPSALRWADRLVTVDHGQLRPEPHTAPLQLAHPRRSDQGNGKGVHQLKPEQGGDGRDDGLALGAPAESA